MVMVMGATLVMMIGGDNSDNDDGDGGDVDDDRGR